MNDLYDIVIVGAGPSGLTASIYARRSNKKVLVLEATYYGGAIVNTNQIENYPTYENITGYGFATKLFNQAKSLGAQIIFEKVVEIRDGDIKEVVTSKNTYQTKTIILATGSESRLLGIDREKELTGKGISYCATCDGALYKNKNIAVIGERNAALEDTIYLSDIASKVYLICRKESFNADQMLVDKVKEKGNIEIIYNKNIKSLNGDKLLGSITLNDDKNIEVSALFVSVGRVPENENFKNIIKVDDKGYIITDENCHTNIEGIFASGDNRVKSLRQLVTACSDGAIAATEAVKYINKKTW